MANDGIAAPPVSTIKPKHDPDEVIEDTDSEHSAEAAGGNQVYDIDAGLRATHGADQLGENEMETKPVDRVAAEIVDDDNEELAKKS